MFLPVLWLVLSSFKTQAGLLRFPPDLLPYDQQTVTVEGYADAAAALRRNHGRRFAVRFNWPRCAASVWKGRWWILPILARLIRVSINDRTEVREATSGLGELHGAARTASIFMAYLRNSVIVTVAATIVTLLINSMAAFALAKYQFRGSTFIFLLIISTLMIPISVILVPVFLVITGIGWNNNLWGVIIPGAATPTGVFLLRQYMLTIPDELLDSARIDGGVGVAHLLATGHAALSAGAGRAGNLLRHVALERLPLAADRAQPQRTLHPSGRPGLLPGRTQHPVELRARHDRDDAAADHAGLCGAAALYHDRHRDDRDEMTCELFLLASLRL
jgi:ABC-type glycerol-3-phosphate transport system permease component